MRADTKFIKPYKPRRYAIHEDDLRRWSQAGLSDEQIARKFGAERSTIAHARMRLGIPAHALIKPIEEEEL